MGIKKFSDNDNEIIPVQQYMNKNAFFRYVEILNSMLKPIIGLKEIFLNLTFKKYQFNIIIFLNVLLAWGVWQAIGIRVNSYFKPTLINPFSRAQFCISRRFGNKLSSTNNVLMIGKTEFKLYNKKEQGRRTFYCLITYTKKLDIPGIHFLM